MAEVARLDRRKAESRQRLLAAARGLFIARGYHATRPQDIARSADVGHGTFYLHFADKRACFLAFAEQAKAEAEAFMRPRIAAAQGMEAQIRAMLEGVMDYAAQNPGVLKAAMTDLSVIAAEEGAGETLGDSWARQWAAHIIAGQASGAVHADYDAEIMGRAVIGLIQGAARLCSGAERARIIDNVTRFLVRGLAPHGAQAAAHGRFLNSGEPTP